MVACTAYSFIVSAGIAALVNVIPGLKLRASEEAELLGMDDDQLGEFAYDYVEVRRDYLAWTPAVGEMEMLRGVPAESQKMESEELRSRGVDGDGLAEMRNVHGEIMPHMNWNGNGNGVDRLGSSLSTGSQEKTALVEDDLRRR